jgi:hypothetical protein
MVFNALRSGWTERHCHNKINDCKAFLDGPYPNLSKFSLVKLTQLKFTIEDNYVVIQNEIADSREEIETFLLSQWRGNHENLVSCSTPSETSTFDRMCRYCNVKTCETDEENDDIKFDDEFLCHVCGQSDCVKFGFRGPGFGVHSPRYGANFSQFRTNKSAHKKSLVALALYRRTKIDYLEKNYDFLMLHNL